MSNILCAVENIALRLLLVFALAPIGGCDPEQTSGPRFNAPADAQATRAILSELPKVERPNILLILVDTLRRDHLGTYGYERDTSPNIDALAKRSIRYERAYSQSSWTIPSTAALLSARYASDLGIRRQHDRLSDEVLLLPEVLKQNGYRTGAVVSHVFISRRWNFDQGYDFFDGGNVKGHAAVTSAGVTDAALRFIDRSFGAGPSFLLVHYFDPHADYIEHEGYRFSQEMNYDGPIKSGMIYKYVKSSFRRSHPEDLAYLLALYDSEIAFTDAQIGRLIRHLEERELLDDTIVILTADHGEEFLEHQSFGHALTLYQEQIHVPLLIRWPGAERGRVSSRVVQTIDIFPSILDYLGIPAPPGIAGLAIQAQTQERPAISETFRKPVRLRSIVSGDYKLIWDLDAEAGTDHRLYRIDRDPEERVDVLEREPQVAARLQSELQRRFGRLEMKHAPSSSPRVELSDEEKRALEALGYTQ